MATGHSIESGRIYVQEYGSRYYWAKNGQRFSVTHQTPSTDVTGQTSFAATTPTFILYGANVALPAVLSGVSLAQVGTVAGGVISLAVAVDTTNRFSTGGTAVVPQNMRTDSATASVYTFSYGATAAAAGTGTRYIWEGSAPATLGTVTSLDFLDGLVLDKAGSTAGKFTGSLLVYTWAATTGPSWKFQFEWVEA